MWNTLKIFFSRIKVYSFWIITCAVSVSLAILAFLVRSKNRKIKELQQQVALRTARLELEQVLLKHQATLEEIRKLRQADVQVYYDLQKIESQLSRKLSSDLTAEQLVEKFREVGIDWTE